MKNIIYILLLVVTSLGFSQNDQLFEKANSLEFYCNLEIGSFPP